MPGTWKFVHLMCTFTFVAALLSAHWNVVAARRTDDWGRRAALLEANLRVTRSFGLVSLVLLGVFGNAVSLALGHHLAEHAWLRWVNVMWLVTLAFGLLIDLPATARLATLARAGSEGRSVADFTAAVRRWRLANATLLASFVGFLSLMVFHWRT
jgi:hypothetical protein